MNHYINLLEETERHYFSAAESSPLLKVGAGAVALAAVGGVYLMFQSMTVTIREAERLSSRWEQIEKDVEAAKERVAMVRRVEESQAALAGWSGSRYPWHEVLGRIQAELPAPQERFQFTRLYAEEEIEGLRGHRPGVDERVHPWRRTALVELRGLISGLGVERAYARMEQDMVRPDAEGNRMFERARLENSVLQTEVTARDEAIYQFNFSMVLTPREVKP